MEELDNTNNRRTVGCSRNVEAALCNGLKAATLTGRLRRWSVCFGSQSIWRGIDWRRHRRPSACRAAFVLGFGPISLAGILAWSAYAL